MLNDSGGGWRVADLTRYIREMFEIDFRLKDVQVIGEISNFTAARSGHLYFTLKDDQAQIKCVMWRSAAQRLWFRPKDGDAVTVRGRVTVYEAGGQYQLYADTLEQAGQGALAAAFEQMKQRLAAEGLFDPVHKQPLPRFPRKIGIVTSADAAALRDIINVLRRRYPLVQVLIAPTLVQGNDAPPQIIRSLQWLDGRDDVDTIIVARGGGSMEDLWAFNDEAVARAIFAARTPVISGVGHEVDFTIADFVADRRAPTPSAAAELAVPDIMELRPLVDNWQFTLQSRINDGLLQRRQHVETFKRALTYLGPQVRVRSDRLRLNEARRGLRQALSDVLREQRGTLAVLSAQLAAVGPEATLARGYAIVRQPDGRVVRSTSGLSAGSALSVRVSDGAFGVVVTGTSPDDDGA